MTTETNNRQALGEKIKSFAFGLLGAIFTTMGVTYFKEQASYNVPKILYPVFKLFGNVGLAIGLIVLGLIFIIVAYRKFVKHNGKPAVIIVAIAIFVGLGATIGVLSDKNGLINSNNTAENTVDKVNNAVRPKLDNQKANSYLDNIERIAAEMQKAKESNDNELFKKLDEEYLQSRNVLTEIIQEIYKEKIYSDFIHYNAKVLNTIEQLRSK